MTAIRRRWVVLGFAAVIVAAAAVGTFAVLSSQSGARIDPDNARLVALGGAVYAAECAACHGANLEGQPNWRQRRADGRLPAPPHDPSGHTWHHPDAQLFALTKFGTDVVAVGDGGTVVRRSNGQWHNVPDVPPALAYLRAVTVTEDGRMITAGGAGTLIQAQLAAASQQQ